MTRAERAARAEARLRARKERIAKEIAQVQTVQRGEDRKVRDKRRYLVGKMVDDAGLFAWTDADLTAVFQALTSLLTVSQPGAVLASFLQDVCGPPGMSVEGMAHPADGVAPTVPVGHCAHVREVS